MSISYLIEIDANDNGDYTDIGDSIAVDVLHVEWRLGMSEPFATVSDVAEALITVRNNDRQYSPDVSDNLYGKPLRIRSDDGTTLRTHFTGFMREIVPQAGENGQQLSQIIAYGREQELIETRVRLPLMVDVRADEAIESILAQVRWRYAILDGRCIIGRDSIGDSDIFPDETFSKSIETGKSTFAFVGDDWGDGLSARQAIAQFTDAESGRFIFTREGNAQFTNRHYLLRNSAVVATFDDDMTELVYHYGNVVNHLEVVLTPRSVGAEGSVLWESDIQIKVLAGSRIQIVARYQQDNDSIGAIDVIAPQATVDYQAFRDANTQINPMTDVIAVWLVETSVSASMIEIENPTSQDVYLTQLQLRGTPLIMEEAQTYIAEDTMSIALNGYQPRTLSLPVFSNSEDAVGLLAWELQRSMTPRGTVRELQTNTRNHPLETLDLNVLDLISVTETQTGHSDTYLIVGEHHEVDKGGTRHRVSWLLEPSETSYFFIIGTHSIGDTEVVMALR